MHFKIMIVLIMFSLMVSVGVVCAGENVTADNQILEIPQGNDDAEVLLTENQEEPETFADLELIKKSNTQKVNKGDTIIWTIEVKNKGPDIAKNVRVIERLTGDIESYKFKASKGDFNPLEGIWTIGDMDAGDTQHITIYSKTLSDADTVNRAWAVSDTPDPNEDNNNDSASVTVKDYSESYSASPSKMHPTANPVLLILLSLITIFCLTFKRKYY